MKLISWLINEYLPIVYLERKVEVDEINNLDEKE
jgi:hypothetical protein